LHRGWRVVAGVMRGYKADCENGQAQRCVLLLDGSHRATALPEGIANIPSVSRRFLHVNRQSPAFAGDDRCHFGNEQLGPSRLRPVQKDYSICSDLCRFSSKDGLLRTFSEESGFALYADFAYEFVRWGGGLIAVYLHVLPVGRRARSGLGFSDSSAVTAAKGGKRQAGKKQTGGASCAHSHAIQDAKDFPFSDSPKLTISETHRIRRRKVDR
jgi:hypothetical protein